MQKVLEDANVKLASVATDWLGVSGRDILSRMLDGEQDAGKLADLCRGRLRDKIPEMQRALEGRMTDHHRWMLRRQREQLEFLEAQIAKLDAKIQELMSDYQKANHLDLFGKPVGPRGNRLPSVRCSHERSRSEGVGGEALC